MEKPKGSLISYFSRMVTRGGGINLAQGKPGFAPPTELLEILKEKTDTPSLHQYAPGIGNFKLLEILCRYYSRYLSITEDHLLIVQGATEGIFLSFFYLSKILKKPFTVLSFDPDYESYPQLARVLDVPIEYTEFDEDLKVDFQRLEEILKQKRIGIMFIASPGNPLGKVWERQEISRVIALAEKYDFYIILDAVYQDLYFDEPPFNPLALQSKKLFYVGSFSKMLSITGWRIGYMITTEAHMAALRDIHDYTGLCAPSIFQEVIAEYLSRFDWGKEYTADIRRKCKESYLYMRATLEKTGFRVSHIGGGYFIWAKLPRQYRDAFLFASELYRKESLGIVPGENFSGTKKDYVRLNIATDLPITRQAAQRIERFIKNKN
jgi:aspartate/methionine/tyrosine aminotransferase